MAVLICPRFCFCGESISKNAFRWFESVYRPKMPEMHLQNFEKLQSRKLLVKYSAYAECEIIHFVNCEILLLRRNVKWNLPTFASANISHLRSKYFTAKLFHLPGGQISLKKASLATCFFLWRVSDLDAKPCVADLDARPFCRGYTNPLAMMGVKKFRVLPDF